MGARLSQPRGPSGTTEASVPTRAPPPPSPSQPWGRRPFNSRTLVAPAAAATMALLLFVYARTSIRAAKANAQRHRDADSGGEGLSLLNESRRRHGVDRKLEDGGVVRQLAGEVKREWSGSRASAGDRGVDSQSKGRSAEDHKIRQLSGKGG